MFLSYTMAQAIGLGLPTAGASDYNKPATTTPAPAPTTPKYTVVTSVPYTPSPVKPAATYSSGVYTSPSGAKYSTATPPAQPQQLFTPATPAKGTYNPTTGAYVSSSGAGYSTATPPAGAVIVGTTGKGAGGTYNPTTHTYTAPSGAKMSTATPPAGATIVTSDAQAPAWAPVPSSSNLSATLISKATPPPSQGYSQATSAPKTSGTTEKQMGFDPLQALNIMPLAYASSIPQLTSPQLKEASNNVVANVMKETGVGAVQAQANEDGSITLKNVTSSTTGKKAFESAVAATQAQTQGIKYEFLPNGNVRISMEETTITQTAPKISASGAWTSQAQAVPGVLEGMSFSVVEAKPFQLSAAAPGTYGVDTTKAKKPSSLLEAVQAANQAAQEANAKYGKSTLPGTLPDELVVSLPGMEPAELVKAKSYDPGKIGEDKLVTKSGVYKEFEGAIKDIKAGQAEREDASKQVLSEYDERAAAIGSGSLFKVSPSQVSAYKEKLLENYGERQKAIEAGTLFTITPEQITKYKAAILAGDYTPETKERVAALAVPTAPTNLILESEDTQKIFLGLGAVKAKDDTLAADIAKVKAIEIPKGESIMVLEDKDVKELFKGLGASQVSDNTLTFTETKDGQIIEKKMTKDEYLASLSEASKAEGEALKTYQNILNQEKIKMAKPDSPRTALRAVPFVGSLADDALNVATTLPSNLGNIPKAWDRSAPVISDILGKASEGAAKGDVGKAMTGLAGAGIVTLSVPFQATGELGKGSIAEGLTAWRADLSKAEGKTGLASTFDMTGELAMKGLDYYASASIAGAGRDILGGSLKKAAVGKIMETGSKMSAQDILALSGKQVGKVVSNLPKTLPKAISQAPKVFTKETAVAAAKGVGSTVKGAFRLGQVGSHGDIVYKIAESPIVQQSKFLASNIGSKSALKVYRAAAQAESGLLVGGLGYKSTLDVLGAKPIFGDADVFYGAGAGAQRAIGETVRYTTGGTFGGKPVETYAGDERAGIVQGFAANYPYYFSRQWQARSPTSKVGGGLPEVAVVGMNIVGRTFITEQAAEDVGLLKPGTSQHWLPSVGKVSGQTIGGTIGLAGGRMVGQEILLENVAVDYPWESTKTFITGKGKLQERFVYDIQSKTPTKIVSKDYKPVGKGDTKGLVDVKHFEKLWSAEPSYLKVDVKPGSAKASPKADSGKPSSKPDYPSGKIDAKLKIDTKLDTKSRLDTRAKPSTRLDVRPDYGRLDIRPRPDYGKADDRIKPADQRIKPDDKLKQDDKMKPDDKIKPDDKLKLDEKTKIDTPGVPIPPLFGGGGGSGLGMGGEGGMGGREIGYSKPRSVYADLLNVMRSQIKYGTATMASTREYEQYVGREQAGVKTLEQLRDTGASAKWAPKFAPKMRWNKLSLGKKR